MSNFNNLLFLIKQSKTFFIIVVVLLVVVVLPVILFEFMSRDTRATRSICEISRNFCHK